MYTVEVVFSRKFKKGNLKGLTIHDQTVSFPDLKHAESFILAFKNRQDEFFNFSVR